MVNVTSNSWIEWSSGFVEIICDNIFRNSKCITTTKDIIEPQELPNKSHSPHDMDQNHASNWCFMSFCWFFQISWEFFEMLHFPTLLLKNVSYEAQKVNKYQHSLWNLFKFCVVIFEIKYIFKELTIKVATGAELTFLDSHSLVVSSSRYRVPSRTLHVSESLADRVLCWSQKNLFYRVLLSGPFRKL